jgi:FAD/FMN-containing dehydrogenase
MADEFLAQCADIVGAAHVLTDAHDMASALSEPRGLYHGRARAVLRPGSVAEASKLLALCNAARVPVVPQGGNTGLVGGQTPDTSGTAVVLSLTRLNRVREIDPQSNTMTVEAGLTLGAAQAAAEGTDRLFPLSLASEGSCTIGGNLATNAGGTAVIAYGNARDLVLGIECVLADGRVLSNLSKLKKDNTGYDLKHLIMGSEGTLGVITAATLKLFERPRAVETAFIGLASPAQALDLLVQARAAAGGTITTFEVVPRIGIEFVLRHARNVREPLGSVAPWYVLLEISGHDSAALQGAMSALLEAALEAGLIEDAVVAASLEHRKDFWRLREELSDAQKPEGGSIKHDISVPLARVPAFIGEATRAVEGFVPGARVVAFGHLGDGNVHFNVSQPVGADKAVFLAKWHAMNEIVHAIVLRHGGSISAEHGIGQLKREELARVKNPVALEVMRAVKAALDPKGILNPGKVL